MELVYLWVEEYKNIKNQGFNFSPRFECNFKDNELTIDEKKDYVSIFPDNINITAIVGANGSGKSSILEGIEKDKIIVRKKGKLYSSHFKKSYSSVKLLEYNALKDHDFIYIDFDLIKIHPKSFTSSLGLGIDSKNLYKKIENNTTGSLDFNILKFRENFYNLIIECNESFKLDKLFNFNPIKIKLSDYIYPHEKFLYIKELIDYTQTNKFSKEKLLVFIYSQLCIKENLKMTELNTNILSIENEILEKNNIFKREEIDKFYKLLESIDKEILSMNRFNVIYREYKYEILKLIEIGYLKIDLFDLSERSYYDLSQGERKLFTESLMMYDAIKKSKKDDILLVLDEPDLTLHPAWQKKYIQELINLLSIFPEKNFHIIITSHSPFILSDLPKENIIFLENGEQKYPFKDKQTFGANIHTLLSDGFFMSNRLMGEFSKEKINEVIKYLNPKNKESEIKSDEEAKNIINIIGEPILKNTLLSMYDDKVYKNESKLDKLKRKEIELKKEIKKLENKLDEKS